VVSRFVTSDDCRSGNSDDTSGECDGKSCGTCRLHIEWLMVGPKDLDPLNTLWRGGRR
jgi:ferredoxin